MECARVAISEMKSLIYFYSELIFRETEATGVSTIA